MPLPDRVRLRDMPSLSDTWADAKRLIRTRGPHTLLFAAISIAIPIGLVMGFAHDTKTQPRPPEIIYIQNWSPNRTDADIIAQQKQERAAQEAWSKERKRQFKALDDKLKGWL